jgi:hypothetical protein
MSSTTRPGSTVAQRREIFREAQAAPAQPYRWRIKGGAVLFYGIPEYSRLAFEGEGSLAQTGAQTEGGMEELP